MSNEVENDVVEPQEIDVSTLNPAEQRAFERGWKPKDHWSGDESEWVSAEVFNARGELIDVISSQSKKVKSLTQVIEDLKSHMEVARKQAHDEAIAELEAQRIVAMEESNFEEAVKIEGKIRKEEAKAAAKPVEDEQEIVGNEFSEYFQNNWISKNEWYNKDGEMKADADLYGERYLMANPSATPEDVFKYVDRKIRKDYPEKFKVVNKAPAVASSNGTGKATGGASAAALISKLTAEELKIGQRFEKLGVMTLEQYAKDIDALNKAL